ncbi:hypothetical protein B0T19DRAFT_462756 [Cercophora scortea]|uniref:Uncharacterized protein n=1 Tax=Cercophora scortea TaxID=314031 RepID=A0AAE0IDY5_9PEZI|nr:hypothetical protein B0T19DRAFT_462756 [Cercophora scortea]
MALLASEGRLLRIMAISSRTYLPPHSLKYIVSAFCAIYITRLGSLVAEMHETLSTIHNTIASLNSDHHDARLDELEKEREDAIQSILSQFAAESTSLAQRRQAERDEIADRRRREDEERERRRRLEDEELAQRDSREDKQRNGDVNDRAASVEERTDDLMAEVEEEAQRMLEEGRERLRILEERRKEINRLIDEQLQRPLPPAPTRSRTKSIRTRSATGGLPQLVGAIERIFGNSGVKAPEDSSRGENEASRSAILVEAKRVEEAGERRIPVAPETHDIEPTPHLNSPDGQPFVTEDVPEHHEAPSAPAQSTPLSESENRNALPGEDSAFQRLEDAIDTRARSPTPSLPVAAASDSQPVENPKAVTEPTGSFTAHEQDIVDSTQEANAPIIFHVSSSASVDEERESLAGESSSINPLPPSNTTAGSTEEPTRRMEEDDNENEERTGPGSPVADSSPTGIPGTLNIGAVDTCLEPGEAIQGTMTHGIDELTTWASDERGERISLSHAGGMLHDTLPAAKYHETETREPLEEQHQLEPSDDTAVKLPQPAENDFAAESNGMDAGATTTNEPDEETNDGLLNHDFPSAGLALESSALTTEFDQGTQRQSSLGSLDANNKVFKSTENLAEHERWSRDIPLPDEPRAVELVEQHTLDSEIIGLDTPKSEAAASKIAGHTETSFDSTMVIRDLEREALDSEYNEVMEPKAEEAAGLNLEGVHMKGLLYQASPEEEDLIEDVLSVESREERAEEGGVEAGIVSGKDQLSHLSERAAEDSSYIPTSPSSSTPISHPEPSREPEYVPLGRAESQREAQEDHSIDEVLLPQDRLDDKFVMEHLASEDVTHVDSQLFATPSTSAAFLPDERSQSPEEVLSENRQLTRDNLPKHSATPQHGEQATTVNGEDDLFDDDDRSDGRVTNSGSHSPAIEFENITDLPREVDDGIRSIVPPAARDLLFHHSQDTELPNLEVESREISHLWDPDNLNNSWADEVDTYFDDAEPHTESCSTPTQTPSPPAVTPFSYSQGGLSASRHNPLRPRTPEAAPDHSNLESDNFTPRDVTNVPWHARNASTPLSMRSDSTLSSSSSSPVQPSSTTVGSDPHEPAIRDSWPTTSHSHLDATGRPRNDSQLSSISTSSKTADYNNSLFGHEKTLTTTTLAPSPVARWQAAGNQPAPGSLFHKMRSVFEPQTSRGLFMQKRAETAAHPHEDRLRVLSITTEVHIDDDDDDDDTNSAVTGSAPHLLRKAKKKENNAEVMGDLRLPWLWVEGWRARLRGGGDIVEKARWEWRVDDHLSRIQRRSMLNSENKGSGKSVHWA